MRTVLNFNNNWTFHIAKNEIGEIINLPHTWNGTDGQDGGNDYMRCECLYEKSFYPYDLPQGDEHYLEFKGVNASAKVLLNGKLLTSHDGGYSTFRVQIDGSCIDGENILSVYVDNSENDNVYPQTADFTFYGGIYRDVNIIGVGKNHFDLNYYGSIGAKITPKIIDGFGHIDYSYYIQGEGKVELTVFDEEGKIVAKSENGTADISPVIRWNGTKNPYLYTARLTLTTNGELNDIIEKKIGFREFCIKPNSGFFLNGVSYPLRGVCRHQDRPQIGNALQKYAHEEDISLILEMGANTIRLAHYQQDDYFYDLCDEKGLVVWAEIPYISRHQSGGDGNAVSQMTELIVQQYHHPSIICWGISNEITMKRSSTKDRLALHKKLNALCKSLDSTRATVLACYMISNFRNKLNSIPDMISYNLYFGWYLPFFFLAGNKLDRYRKKYPDRIIGLSEYGAEGMPNLHSAKPRRGDNSEEYQCIYHENMLKIINKRPFLWATHVWNMFDFAADARNQGGEAGMNHKGLVTFDRKTKKDVFYLYKAFWSNDPFVHICGKRFSNRTGSILKIKVYSNQCEVSLYNNDKLVATKCGDKIFNFSFPAEKINRISVSSNTIFDCAEIVIVNKPNSSYKIRKTPNKSWEK